MSCGVGRRHSSDPCCCGPAATTPIGPLAWELLYAVGVGLKIQKRLKKILHMNIYRNIIHSCQPVCELEPHQCLHL